MKFITPYKIWIAIILIWLFHSSAIIGISLGHVDWFLAKTPLNLFICLFFFIWVFPIDTTKKILVFLAFFGIGMFVEWLGVNYSLLFGEYRYGGNFGPKIHGVPILIGCFWALLALITAAMIEPLKLPIWAKLAASAALMVLLDLFMEQNAPNFDFWYFEGSVPVKNYVTWFLVGLLMQFVIWKSKISGNKTLSYHLYIAQLVFFLFFYLFPIT